MIVYYKHLYILTIQEHDFIKIYVLYLEINKVEHSKYISNTNMYNTLYVTIYVWFISQLAVSSFEINLNWHLKNNIHVVRIIQNECVISNGNCTHNQKKILLKQNSTTPIRYNVTYGIIKQQTIGFHFIHSLNLFIYLLTMMRSFQQKWVIFSNIFFLLQIISFYVHSFILLQA